MLMDCKIIRIVQFHLRELEKLRIMSIKRPYLSKPAWNYDVKTHERIVDIKIPAMDEWKATQSFNIIVYKAPFKNC